MTVSSHMKAHAQPGRVSGPSGLYTAGWGLLAGIALLYLGVLITRPDLQWLALGRSSTAVVDANRGQRTVALPPGELEEMRHTLAYLQTEVGSIRDEAAGRDTREHTLAARVAALEAATSTVKDTSAAIPVAIQRGPDESAVPDKAAALTGATVLGRVEERSKTPARAAAPSPQTTATAAAPTAGAPAQPRPAAAPSAVRIASGPSLDALRLSWQLLLEGHRPMLGPLEPRWAQTSGEPGSFSLMAGPLGTPEEAAKLCNSLKAKRIPCSVSRFGGQPL